MSAAIVQFPSRGTNDRAANRTIIPFAAPRTAPRPMTNARREYTFCEVSRLLALAGESRTQISYLRDLANQCGMPLPKNPRRFRGRLQTGPAMIGCKSRWCALEFDAWLDSQHTPPPGVGAMPPSGAVEQSPPLPAPVRADMRQRARLLAAGGI